ncbi:MAG: EAL domain-containing protein (putative c-di-GMP-specific phosphodiesterase class I) [Cocleimonas sp.]
MKIDGSFIKDICENKIDQIVVKSINEADKVMNIMTVAEYVENQSILDTISSIGIDFA